jgi:hypothetical protein
MPTFRIYVGFSQFEVVEKMNPDIPIGIAKLPWNPDFQKILRFKTTNPEISTVSRQLTPNFQPEF